MLEVPFPPGFIAPDAMGGKTQCYLVVEDGWTLIDSSFDEDTCFDSLCQQLAAIGVSVKDIRRMLVTHFHPDHFGLANRLHAVSNAEVVMHRKDWDMVRFIVESANTGALKTVLGWAETLGVPCSEAEDLDEILAYSRLLFTADMEPDILLDGEDEPVGSGHLRAILTPGHTPGHICLYDERKKLLFSGDHVLAKITTHIAPSFLTDEDLLSQYLASLQKVSRLDVDMVLPAHEQLFTGLRGRVNELLLHHESRLDQILAALGPAGSSAWQIASQVDWAVGLWEQMELVNRILALQETLAHLQLLQQERRVGIVVDDGLTLYTLLDDVR